MEEGEPHICSSSLQIGSVVSAVLVSKRINNMHKKHTVHTHTRAHAHTRPRDNRDNNKILKKNNLTSGSNSLKKHMSEGGKRTV